MEVKLTIDDKIISVREGSTIMEAATKGGVFVPHFCYHHKLSIAANCRMCMVDVAKSPKPVPACATPVVEGMVVQTSSERAKQAQQSVMEFLLINHPLDCPICDQGGECQLQDLAVGYGISKSRYEEEKRVVFEKQLGPLIATDMTRCIHCTRCVRFGREVAGIMELGMVGRGEHAEIMPFIEKTVDSELSGNMIDVCPVGALTSKPFRYTARTWELQRKTAISTHDAWGSHLQVQIKGQTVKRVKPLEGNNIKECWISDRDRFSYQGLTAKDRALTPLSRSQKGRSLRAGIWQDLLTQTKSKLLECQQKHGAESIGFFISPRATQEEGYLLQKLARHLGSDNIDSRLWQRDFKADNLPSLGIAPKDLSTLKTVLFIGADPARELPLLPTYFRRSKTYIANLASIDINHQLSTRWSRVVPTAQICYQLANLVRLAGGECLLKDDTQQGHLFNSDATATTDKLLVEKLKKANGAAVLWLGDEARASAQYGLILSLAQQLAQLCGCKIGSLFGGANEAGLQAVGALPQNPNNHTANLLRADLKAVVLLRCEPADFLESNLLRQTLQQAEFSCALTSHTNQLDNLVDILLPVADFTENEGSYINGFGYREAFTAAVTPPADAKPAWKVLRLLGSSIAPDGFPYNQVPDVQQAIEAFNWAPHPPQSVPNLEEYPLNTAAPDKTAKTLQVYGGQTCYGSDMLVRRAQALQATAIARKDKQLKMNPQDMESLGLVEADTVQIAGTNLPPLSVLADPTLALGTVRCGVSGIAEQTTITVEKVADTTKAAATA